MFERIEENRKECLCKLRVIVCQTQQTAQAHLHQDSNKKNKKTIWVRQFQSYENSFGQAFERERMYLFCNKGQAI